MRFNVVSSGRWFDELASTVHDGLKSLKHEVERLPYLDNSGQHINIVLGAHLLTSHVIADLEDAPLIAYNFEQVGRFDFPEHSQELFKRCIVWDYSAANLSAWEVRGVKAIHVPIGYVSGMTRIPPQDQDIDVLFYGSVSDRRLKILESLSQAGIRVQIAQRVWGGELDSLIARAKVILNLHYQDHGLFEIARCSYLFANSKAVVSEYSDDSADYRYMENGIFWSADLAKSCRAILNDEFLRKETGREAFNNFSRMDESAILQAALCSMKEDTCQTVKC